LAETLIDRWPKMTPRFRSDALAVLLKRTDRCELLLGAIERGIVARGELSASQISFLRNHPNEFIRESAGKLFATPSKGRQEVVEALMPALQMPGDAARGKKIYLERCASCHRAGTDGFNLFNGQSFPITRR